MLLELERPEDIKPIRKELNALRKEELVGLILQYGIIGLFPIELFTLGADKRSFTADELKNKWEDFLFQIHQFDEEENIRTAEMLQEGAELFFKQAKKLPKEEVSGLLKQIAEDLDQANVIRGIGMKQNSEWLYMQVKEEIEAFLE